MLTKEIFSGVCLQNFSTSLRDNLKNFPADVLMEVIVELHENRPSGKKQLPDDRRERIVDIFKGYLQEDFGSGAVNSKTTEEVTNWAMKIVHCMFWLEDPEAWECFSAGVCKSVEFEDVSKAFPDMLDSIGDLRRTKSKVARSEPAFQAFFQEYKQEEKQNENERTHFQTTFGNQR